MKFWILNFDLYWMSAVQRGMMGDYGPFHYENCSNLKGRTKQRNKLKN